MPVSPDLAEDLARTVAVLYENAELALLERLRAALAAGIDGPAWVNEKLAALGNLQQGITTLLEALQQDADGVLREAIAAAYERGQQAAVAELGALPVGQALAAAEAVPGAAVVDRLAGALVADTGPVHQRVLRVGMDVYRQVVAEASATTVTGAATRRQAAERALAKFATKGVTGFVDRAGRSWDMTSYVEMATRSAVGKAAVQAHTDRLTAAGIGLVVVSDSPEECPLCRPWERKILALSGPDGPRDITMEHRIEDGRMVTVHVAGTLDEARRAGLQHPNCRHRTSAYLPGVTRQVPVQQDRASYEQTQQQRYWERQIRAWKRRAAAAMDDGARAAANARVRDYQARVRELVAETGLPRKSHREQTGTAR